MKMLLDSGWAAFAAVLCLPQSQVVLDREPVFASAARVQDLESWVPIGEPSVGGRVTGISVSPFDPRRVLVAGDMLGVGLSTDAGSSWQPTFGFRMWEMADFTWHPSDPNRVWVGSMGGPYLSEDGGRTWSLKRNGFPPLKLGVYSAPIERVLFDPQDSRHLIAAGGSSRRWQTQKSAPAWGAIWESFDEGESWTRISTITEFGSTTAEEENGAVIVGMVFAAGSSTRLYATVDGLGFYRSLDGGTSWSRVATNLPHDQVERVRAHPSDPLTVYVSLGSDGFLPGGVFVSVDGGDSFAGLNAGLPQQSGPSAGNTSRYPAFDIDSFSGDRLLTCDDRFGGNSIYSSATAGAAWQVAVDESSLAVPYPSGLEMEVAEISNGHAGVFYLAGSANFVRSLDGGTTWIDAANIDLPGDRVRGRGYSGLVGAQITVNPFVPGHWIAQGFDAARVLQTKNAGESWTFRATEPLEFGGGVDCTFPTASVAYASLGIQSSGFQGIAKTSDGGDTWQLVAGTGLPPLGADLKASGVLARTQDSTDLWAFAGDDLYFSTNSGEDWANVAPGIGNGWLAASLDGSRIYASGDDQVFVSTDSLNFSGIGGPGKPGRMTVDSTDTLWLAAHDETGNPGRGLWKYTPAQGWVSVLDPESLVNPFREAVEYIVDVAVHPTDPNIIAVTTADPPFRDRSKATGVWISRDAGSTWNTLNAGLPMLRGSAITFDPHQPNRLLLATDGRGFFTLTLSSPQTVGPATASSAPKPLQ